MTREEAILWLNEELRTWENECQSKHPIKEALYAARKALEQEPCKDAVSVASVFEIMGNLMSIPYDFDRSITEKDVSESMDKIRALPRVTPQEPFKPMVEIDLYSVIKQKYIERDVIDKIIADIIDEKDFAYADFDWYKEEVLGAESDELPDDDFRYGMERAIEIIYKHKAESEGKE